MGESLPVSAWPLNQGQLGARMIGMTTGAALAADRARRMVSAPFMQRGCEVLVTSQALAIHGFLAIAMTLDAVARALERLVRARERPRRDLGRRARSVTEGEREYHGQDSGEAHTYQNQVAPIATTTPT